MSAALPPGITLRLMDETNGECLTPLCEACAEFFLETTGLPPGPAEVQSWFIAVPPHGDYARKRIWGVFEEEVVIGAIDASFGHPDDETFWIGLFLLHPAVRGRGLGPAILAWLDDFAAAGGARKIGLAVKRGYIAAEKFWAAQRFVKTREATQDFGAGPVMFDCLERVTAGSRR
jgi:GNAT superfamily N-acetyltransferase